MADYTYPSATNPITSTHITGTITTGTIPDKVTPLDVDILNNNPTLPPMDYTNLDFSSIKLQLLNLLKANAQTFGYSLRDFADSNTAGMLLNMNAYLGQLLSYHADSMVSELFLDTSQTSWGTSRLLSMYGYKMARPKAGVILLAITRRASTNANASVASLEDSSEILLSNSLNRKQFTFGTETFELFPAIQQNDTLIPDTLGDLIIPPYKIYEDISDPDYNVVELQKNTIFCFGLTGTTQTDDFISDGTANQVLTLSNSNVNDSKIVVQVEDTATSTIAGITAYNVWTEISYLSLAGFRTANTVDSISSEIPYLIASFKLSPALYKQKLNGQLLIGTVLELDYNNLLQYANYADFKTLKVFYQTCILSNLTSSKYADDQYVDVLLYHPSYVYGELPTTVAYSHSLTNLVNTVITDSGNIVSWAPNDLLYLLNGNVSITVNGITYQQPQIVSDTQLALGSSAYPDILYLRNNPNYKVAIGRAISSTTMAFGVSADYSTYLESDEIYETTWDGNYNVAVRFGDGTFGKIPPKGSAIKVIYRNNTSTTSGGVVSTGQANQTTTIGSVQLLLRNDYPSSPATSGEDIATAKHLAPAFLSSQDRAVVGSDYTIIAKRYNANYKVATVLAKSEADSSVVQVYTLEHVKTSSSDSIQPLNMTEKLQLYNYLNQYKCFGVTLEIVDGTVRPLDIRIDVRPKPGYVSGQVKSDINTAVISYFNLSKAEMGLGFVSSKFINTVSAVPGILNADFYFGGLETLTMNNGTVTQLGNYIYQQLQDIPSYNNSNDNFPSLGNSIVGLANITKAMNFYEVLALNSLVINVTI